jgi:hypothetical protein
MIVLLSIDWFASHLLILHVFNTNSGGLTINIAHMPD